MPPCNSRYIDIPTYTYSYGSTIPELVEDDEGRVQGWVHQAIDTFRHYSPQEKSDFLLQLAHTLTIIARDTYEFGEEGLTQPARLRRINEVQHRVTSFLVALMRQDVQHYPDDVLVRIILEHPEDLNLQQQLQEAFSHLMAQMASPHRLNFQHGAVHYRSAVSSQYRPPAPLTRCQRAAQPPAASGDRTPR